MKTLILLLTLLFGSQAAAQWQQTSGPEGAMFTNLSIVNGKLLAEVRSNSLYRLDGERWTKLPGVFALDYYPIKDDIMLTRYDGVHLSTDEGQSWQHVLELNAAPQVTFDKDTAYVLHANALYRSTDGGQHWTEIQHQPAIHSLAAMNSILVAGSPNGPGLLRSVDGGSTFVNAGVGLPDTAVVGVLVTDPGFVYAGTNAGIFISGDLGLNWSRYEDGFVNGMPRGNKRLIRSGDFVFLHTDDTTYIATLAGWRIVSTQQLPGVVEHESVMYAPINGRIMTSFFLGESWTKTTPDLLANTVQHIVSAGHAMMATGAAGIFRTTDDGDSWERVRDMYTHLLLSTGSTVLALGKDGDGVHKLIRSHNQGDVWTELEIPGQDLRHVYSLARTTSYVYAGFSYQDMLNTKWLAGGIYRSSDRGTTWEAASNGLPTKDGVPVPIMAIYADDGVQVASTIDGVYRSTDGGDSWTRTDFNGDVIGEYNPIYFQRIGSTIYAGTTNSVFKSSNAGQSWTIVNRGHDFIAGMGRFMDSLIIIEPELTRHRISSLRNGEWVDITSMFPQGVEPMMILEGGLRAYMGTMESGVWIYRKTAGVDPNDALVSSVYPNPATDLVTINAEQAINGTVVVSFFDALGRVAGSHSLAAVDGNVEVDTRDLPSGIYTFTLKNAEGSFTGKLTIQR